MCVCVRAALYVCAVVAHAARVFREKGVMFSVPPLPKRLPSPDEPGIGYDPSAVKRYYDVEVFIEDVFGPDGAMIPLPPRAPITPGPVLMRTTPGTVSIPATTVLASVSGALRGPSEPVTSGGAGAAVDDDGDPTM